MRKLILTAVMTFAAQGAGGMEPPPRAAVSLACDTGSHARLAPLCPALLEALERRFADAGPVLPEAEAGAAPLAVRLEVLRASDDMLSTRLRWRDGPGAPETKGPVIETSVSDATLTPSVLREIARVLVDRSGLPS